ncbi:unnamed protein product [Darwinula stevensoni]|uniref:Endonuclease/exonuclease/phosphatase domain-containing protein n=1 Tax=Darwinula stevensoni TaxID=69355 RepID=A0A7R9AE68_9CRUS|nr:unnamed protein product [Darwinula stevensoni]CAG0902062.1 unnamed protein product [Darwinula stevensoni]
MSPHLLRSSGIPLPPRTSIPSRTRSVITSTNAPKLPPTPQSLSPATSPSLTNIHPLENPSPSPSSCSTPCSPSSTDSSFERAVTQLDRMITDDRMNEGQLSVIPQKPCSDPQPAVLFLGRSFDIPTQDESADGGEFTPVKPKHKQRKAPHLPSPTRPSLPKYNFPLIIQGLKEQFLAPLKLQRALREHFNFTPSEMRRARGGFVLGFANAKDMNSVLQGWPTEKLGGLAKPPGSLTPTDTRKFVIKGVSREDDPEDLATELRELGFEVVRLLRMRKTSTGEALNCLLFETKADMSASLEEEGHISIGPLRFLVEPFQVRPRMLQCLRCHQYGHTKAKCMKNISCICAGDHEASSCPNRASGVRRCITCKGNHRADSRTCPSRTTHMGHLAKKFPTSNLAISYAAVVAKRSGTPVPIPAPLPEPPVPVPSPPPIPNHPAPTPRKRMTPIPQPPKPSSPNKSIKPQTPIPPSEPTIPHKLIPTLIELATKCIQVSPARALTILHININGFNAKRAEFINYLEEAKPHIICVSELKRKTPPCIKGFYSFKPPHPNRPYNGGSAIFISDKLDAEDITPSQPTATNIELIGISIKANGTKINVFHLYCPPSTLTQSDLDRLPNNFLDPTLLIGDLNAHSPILSFCDKTNRHGRLISSFLDNSDFSLISSPEPTHSAFSNPDSPPYRLDLTLANPYILPLIHDCCIGKDLGSDHLPILVTINLFLQERVSAPRTTPDFPRADWTRFQLTLDTCLPDTLSILSTDNILSATQLITEAIQIAQDDSIPPLTTKTSRPYLLSPTTLSLIKKRRATRRKFHLTKAPCLKRAILDLNREISLQLKLDANYYWDNYWFKENQSVLGRTLEQAAERTPQPAR